MNRVPNAASPHRWRDLSKPTTLLTVVTLVCLVLQVSKGAVDALSVRTYSLNGSLQSAPSFAFGRLLDRTLLASIMICAAVSLVWLYLASVNAHVLKPRMKYSPLVGLVWFFVPGLGTIMPLSVVYDIWAASGGDQKGGRVMITWWCLTVPSVLLCIAWASGGLRPNLLSQAVIAGASLSFLILARRLNKLQQDGLRLQAFGDDPEAEAEAPRNSFAEHLDMPLSVVEDTMRRLEPQRHEGKLQPPAGSGPKALSVNDRGPPAVVYVRRPGTEIQ